MDRYPLAAIDPGLKGAITIVYHDREEVHDMPTVQDVKAKGKKRNSIDEKGLVEILRGVAYCVVESQHERPTRFAIGKDAAGNTEERKQGTSSQFQTALGYGVIRGILAALEIPREYVHPRTWQAHFKIAGNSKEQSARIAEQLFPGLQFRGARGGIKDGRSDSALLAEYARRRLTHGQ